MPGPDPFTLPMGSPTPPQSGVWLDNFDAQFLIQWSLQEVPTPQATMPTAATEPPSTTFKARIRLFQEIFDTNLTAARPIVPFSLQDGISPYPYLQGSLVLLQQSFESTPVLLVRNLKFTGFQKAQITLYPSASGNNESQG
jgi:hypothetical protein